jgi:hypothetical protein
LYSGGNKFLSYVNLYLITKIYIFGRYEVFFVDSMSIGL